MSTLSEKYYAGAFPDKLYVHGNFVSTEDGAVIAELHSLEQVAFTKELLRRWNAFPAMESGIMDIRKMAQKRKTLIRMQNGMMLDTFCGQLLQAK